MSWSQQLHSSSFPNMFRIVAIIAFAAIVAADDNWNPSMSPETYRQIQADCVTETGLTSEQEERIRKGDYTDETEARAYNLCRAKKLGIFNEETGFNADRIMARLQALQLDPTKAQEIVEKCADKNEQGSTIAEWAFRGMACFESPEFNSVFREAVKRQWKNNLFAKGGMLETVANSN